MRMVLIFTLLLCLFGLGPILAAERPLPRVVIALYNGKNSTFENSESHRFAVMILNHLGLDVRPHDVSKGLPEIGEDKEVRGVLSWFLSGTTLRSKSDYLNWARRMVQSGKKFVIVGDPGFWAGSSSELAIASKSKRFLAEMGIEDLEEWVQLTYDHEFVDADPNMIGFERHFVRVKPAYQRLKAGNYQTQSFLSIQRKGQDDTKADLVLISPKGGYIADGYAVFSEYQGESQIRQWFINPFEFFRRAFDTDDLPKPDTTTLAGNRIYYSHIDGDGWLNRTLLEDLRKEDILSSQVILDKILKAYPDMPVSVSAIAAEVDPTWVGTPKSQQIAREIFALDNVEMGTHTYSHPFQWGFFADGDADRERAYLSRYRQGAWDRPKTLSRLMGMFNREDDKNIYLEGSGLSKDFTVPRAYANERFDLNKEIEGSARYLESLAPPGKKVKLIMWSGNTTPFEAALVKARNLGLVNINGGDSRMDRKYPSYAWVSPIGRKAGNEQQIYSSNSNENTYTDLWTGGFHGFRYLANTIFNTESPIRVKPFNIYYHMYSGERDASFQALISNIELARSQRLTMITASEFSKLAQGFFTAQLIPLSSKSWRIENRGDLQTIRFDHHALKTVDYGRSTGLVGHLHLQGSLYVYLDSSVNAPVIHLKDFELGFDGQPGQEPSLYFSTWPVWGVERTFKGFSFNTQGWSKGKMKWVVDSKKEYQWFNEQGLLVPPGELSIKLARGVMEVEFKKSGRLKKRYEVRIK